jgi:hypothetical protein
VFSAAASQEDHVCVSVDSDPPLELRYIRRVRSTSSSGEAGTSAVGAFSLVHEGRHAACVPDPEWVDVDHPEHSLMEPFVLAIAGGSTQPIDERVAVLVQASDVHLVTVEFDDGSAQALPEARFSVLSWRGSKKPVALHIGKPPSRWPTLRTCRNDGGPIDAAVGGFTCEG